MILNELKIAISFKINSEGSKRFLEIISKVFGTPYFLLFVLMVFALFIRIYFFIGFAGGDPQDDGIYLNIAKDILRSGFYNHNLQKNLVLSEEMINPIYIFPSRLLFNYFNSLFLFSFGVNDYTASLFPLICSLLSIYIIYKIGTLLFDFRVGLLSGFFFAIMPLDIVYSTRITPDVPVAFFITLGIYLFLKGIKENKGRWLFTAGIAVGLGYLVKSTAIMSMVVMILLSIIHWIREKNFPRKALYVLLGFMLLFLLEGLYYQIATGYFFLRPNLISKVYKSKYGSEWIYFVSQLDLKWILIEYPVRTVMLQLRTMLNLSHHRPELSYFGYIYYPVIVAFFYMLFRRIANRGVIIAWFLFIYFFVEFGPIEINFGLDPLIKYGLIEKQPRYLTIFLAPSVILLSLFLVNLKIPFKKTFVCSVMLILSISSYKCASSAHDFFRGHTKDLREATSYLQDLPPRSIYADWLGVDQSYFYSGFTVKNLKNINAIANNPSGQHSRNSYVILGGARGSGVIAQSFESRYQKLLMNVPDDWIPLKTIQGKKDVYRKRDLTIYYVPE